MSSLGRAGVAFGVLLGLAVVVAGAGDDFTSGDGGALTSGTVAFLATIVAFAAIPYLVFARVERAWSRPLAITVLAVLAAAHLFATAGIVSLLEEDALSSIGFLTVPPLLAAAVGVVAIAITLTRAVARRRGE